MLKNAHVSPLVAPRILLLALVALVAAGLLTPGLASAADTSATIHTRVIDAVSGEPVLGVQASLYFLENGAWHSGAASAVAPDGSLDLVPDATGTYVLYIDGRSGYSDAVIGSAEATPELDTSAASPNAKWPVTAPAATFANATRIVVGSSGRISLPTVVLQPKPTPYGSILGRVRDRDTGGAVSFGLVWAYRQDPRSHAWVPFTWVQPQGDGLYRLIGTAQNPLIGDVRVGFATTGYKVSPSWFPAALDVDEARTLHVLADQTLYGVDVGVLVDGKLSGELFWAETKLPVQNGQVAISTSQGGGDAGLVDAAGRWMVSSMPSETYTFGGFQPEGEQPRLTYYGQTATAASSTTVTLPATGSIEGLDIWLSEKPAIAGKVRAEDGTPQPDVKVTAYRRLSGRWEEVGSDYCDGDGRYSIICPVAGVYTLRFSDIGGTTNAADDTGFFLGGVAEIDSARIVAVGSRFASVIYANMDLRDQVHARRATAETAYGLALKTSQETFGDGGATCVVLASGEDILSSVCAPRLAMALSGPMLLTTRDGLYSGVLTEIERLGARKVFVVGSNSVILQRQLELLVALGYEVERVSGSDPYDLSENVADKVAEIAPLAGDAPVFMVNGANVSDALMAAPVAASSGGVMVLVKSSQTPISVMSGAPSLQARSAAVGSRGSVSNTKLASLASAGLDITPAPVGSDLYSSAALFASFARDRGWISTTEIGLASSADLGEALVATAYLGTVRGALLFSGRTTLPTVTKDAIGNSSLDRRVRVFGSPKAISTSVMIQAGSALRPVTVTTPSAPSTVRRNKTHHMTGYVTPLRPTGPGYVRVYKYRLVHGSWKNYGYIIAKLSNASGARSFYSASIRLRYSGRWRLRAYHVSDGVFAAAWSSNYRYVRVR